MEPEERSLYRPAPASELKLFLDCLPRGPTMEDGSAD